MGLGKGNGRGGRRADAGRKLGSRSKAILAKLAALRLPPTAIRIPGGGYAVLTPLETAPAIADALTGIRTVLEAQGVSLARLQQQRNEFETSPAILRRLAELERLVRGDPGLTKPARLRERGRWASDDPHPHSLIPPTVYDYDLGIVGRTGSSKSFMSRGLIEGWLKSNLQTTRYLTGVFFSASRAASSNEVEIATMALPRPTFSPSVCCP